MKGGGYRDVGLRSFLFRLIFEVFYGLGVRFGRGGGVFIFCKVFFSWVAVFRGTFSGRWRVVYRVEWGLLWMAFLLLLRVGEGTFWVRFFRRIGGGGL